MAWVYCGSLLLVGHEDQLVRARCEFGALYRFIRDRAPGQALTPPLAVVFCNALLDGDVEALSPFGAARMSITQSFGVNGVWRLCNLASAAAGDRDDGCGVRVLLFEALLKEANWRNAPLLFLPAFCEREDAYSVRACMQRFLHAPPGCIGTSIMWAL